MSTGQARKGEVTLQPEPESVPRARKFVAGLSLTDDEDKQSRLAAMTSELVSNAVLHARTPFELTVTVQEERIRVSVSDGAEIFPGATTGDPSSLSGRGLRIVDRLADRWGIDPNAQGKTVWFEVDR
ncbi:MAG TPA: ATP-binding protein [Acidimicrobiia bacterium]|jgi:anti-sigma regulatory factor (Ser/Thr protein kinase)